LRGMGKREANARLQALAAYARRYVDRAEEGAARSALWTGSGFAGPARTDWQL
jgi:hypothetical protein